MQNLERKSVYWDFVKSLEPPRVVHIRAMDMLEKDNVFGQVTVRFHTQQVILNFTCRKHLAPLSLPEIIIGILDTYHSF